MKKRRKLVAVFLCLILFTIFVLYKNFLVHSPGKAVSQKNSSGLSDEEYKNTKQAFTTLLNGQDPKISLTNLREMVKADNALLRSCHSLTHDLGHAAYKKYGSFGEAMKFQDEICNSGYMHGVIESYFSQNNADISVLQSVCGGYPEGKFLAWECYHGVGHGLMFFTQNDLPKSLALCEEYGTDFAQSTCINGVFMENFNTNEQLHPSKFLKADDPFYPCGEEKTANKAPCYLYTSTYYLSMHKNDYIGALRWCNGAELFYGGICVKGVGMQAMKENINDVKFVERICTSAPALKVASCVEGMTGLYINHFGSLEPTQKMCGELEEKNRPFCYGTIQSNISLFSL